MNVKAREKYAPMNSRAEQRRFDWRKSEIFLQPAQAEQKANMPLPPPDTSTTVLKILIVERLRLWLEVLQEAIIREFIH